MDYGGRWAKVPNADYAASKRSFADSRAWSCTLISASSMRPPSSLSTTHTQSSMTAPWICNRSIALRSVPPVVTTSSTKSTRSPAFNSPSKSLDSPCSIRCFRTIRIEHGLSKDFEGELNAGRSEEHTSELQSLAYLVCRLLLEKKKTNAHITPASAYRHTPPSAPPTRYRLGLVRLTAIAAMHPPEPPNPLAGARPRADHAEAWS